MQRSEKPAEADESCHEGDRPTMLAVLRNSDLLGFLPAHCTDGLLAECHLAHAQRGEVIYSAGDPVLFAGIVGTGFVKVSRPIEVGHEMAVELLGPGQSFALKAAIANRNIHVNVTAACPCWYLKIPTHVFGRQYHEGVPLSESISRCMAPRIDRAKTFQYQIAKGNVAHRLAVVLLTLADSTPSTSMAPAGLTVPVSRLDLAEMAGTTIETTNRIFSQWQKDGVLLSRGKCVTIMNQAALERVAAD